MAQVYSPWMPSEEGDITEHGFVTPVYEEQAEEPEDSGDAEESDDMKEHMQMALETINYQAAVIKQLQDMLTGKSDG